MGWLFSVGCIIGYGITGDSGVLIASGLFAIAGAISFKDFYKKE